MQYLQQPLNFSLPQSGCTGSTACPAGTYTIGTYTVTLADPGANRLDLSISHGEAAIFAKIIGAGTVNAGSSARATQPYVSPCGMCVLGNVPDAFNVSGNGGVSVTGAGFQDNSTDPSAARLQANGGLTVSPPYSIGIAPGGGYIQGGTGTYSPTPVSKPPVSDPLANVPQPTTPTSCSAGPTGSPPNATPACYTTLGGGGSLLTLNPGTYIITGTLLLGDFGVAGTGVTLYFACSAWPTPCASGGEAGANIVGSSNGSLNISAPTAGSGQPYPGMAIFADRNNTSQLQLQSNGSATINGTIYAKSAQIMTSGNGGYTINGTVIVSTSLLSANGALNLTYDPNNNYFPPGGSGLIR
jgi:hypothetical protein